MKVHETWQEESQVLWRRVTSDKVVACSWHAVACTNQPIGDVDYKRPSL